MATPLLSGLDAIDMSDRLEQALSELSRTPEGDDSARLQETVRLAAQVLRCDRAGVWLGGRPPCTIGYPAAPSGAPAGRAPENVGDEGWAQLLVPLRRDEAEIGVIRFERPIAEPWSPEERLFAHSVAARILLRIERSDRLRAETTLRQWQRRVDHVERLARTGSWEWDLNTGRIAWSREQMVIHGLDATTAPTTLQEVLDRVHPDDRARLVEETTKLSETGEPFVLEYRIVRPDGTVRRLAAMGQLMSDSSGTSAPMVGACRDLTERTQAEAALRASEESYRTIFDSSNDAIFVHDPASGAILDANRKACELGGVTLDELRARGVDLLASGPPPYTREAAHARLAAAARGEPQRFEWLSGYGQDGGKLWVEVNIQRVSIRGADRLLALVRDIRERKAAEEHLRRTNEELERRVEERTRELAATNEALEEEVAEHEVAKDELLERTRELEGVFQALPDRYFRLDCHGRILDYRAGSVELPQRSPRSLIGELLFDVIPDAAAARIASAFAEMDRTGHLAVAEYTLHVASASRDFEARVLPLGGDMRIMVVRDITVRKNAERALRDREEHFRKLIENTSDIIAILDPDGIVRYQSPAVERILGYAPEALIGQSIFDFVDPADHPTTRAAFTGVMSDPGSSSTATYRFRHADGSWRVVESTGRTLRPDSVDEGVVINSRDVTERTLAEAALERAKEEAERANRAKSEFLSRMSHELRTPMNSILGFGQLLGRAELSAQQAKSVQHILKAGKHLLNLINEVLEIARIEAGRQDLSLEPVRVGPVLQEAISLVRPLASQWGVELPDGPCADGSVFVRADRQRLVQVLLNLLANAIKYNERGGRVHLTCSVDVASESVAIRVRDTGRGIPPDRVEQLFTPFSRLGAEQTEVEGTGLGLALSQRLCEAMEGSLVLEETGPEGSVFRIDLTAAVDPVSTLDEAPHAPLAAGDIGQRRAVLLYVEDNLANLSLVETILLSRPAWRAVPALQGKLGIELARQHRPDLILLDLHLPDISGEDVLLRLRHDEHTAAIPVVIISADATPASIHRLQAMGADAYLTKPLDVDEFLATVDRFVEVGRR